MANLLATAATHGGVISRAISNGKRFTARARESQSASETRRSLAPVARRCAGVLLRRSRNCNMQYGCDVIDAGGSDTTAPDESVRVPLKQEVMRSSELARLALKKCAGWIAFFSPPAACQPSPMGQVAVGWALGAIFCWSPGARSFGTPRR